MSGTQTVRTAPPTAEPATPDPAAFTAGRDREDPDTVLVDRLAFALAVERRTAPSDEALAQLRNEATVALTNFAFRHLHNNVSEIRQQAVAEHRAAQRPPPGFGALLLASVFGSAIVAAGVLWMQANPDAVAGFLG